MAFSLTEAMLEVSRRDSLFSQASAVLVNVEPCYLGMIQENFPLLDYVFKSHTENY